MFTNSTAPLDGTRSNAEWAGFEATVLELDPDYHGFLAAVAASGPVDSNGEDAASLTLTACQSAYWDPAYFHWERSSPASSPRRRSGSSRNATGTT